MAFQTNKDERAYPRRITNVDVRLQVGVRSWKAYFTDLSAGGAFVESKELPPVGGKIRMDFLLPFPEKGIQVHFQLEAHVVRTQIEGLLSPSGFSARFAQLTEKEKTCLEAFSKKNQPFSRTVAPR